MQATFLSNLPVHFLALGHVEERETSQPCFRFIWSGNDALEVTVRDRKIAVRADQLLVVPPNEAILISGEHIASTRQVTFHSGYLSKFCPISPITLARNAYANKLIDLLLYTNEQLENRQSRMSSILCLLVNEIDPLVRSQHEQEKEERDSLADSVIQGKAIIYAARYMNTHMGNPDLSLDEIARAIGYSPKYFCKEFSSIVSVSPIKYLNKSRVERALALLEQTDASIKSICEMVGIRNASSLSLMIKSKVGMTPLSYRRYRRVQQADKGSLAREQTP